MAKNWKYSDNAKSRSDARSNVTKADQVPLSMRVAMIAMIDELPSGKKDQWQIKAEDNGNKIEISVATK